MPDIGVERPYHSRKGILVLDDEPVVMRVYRVALGAKGYTIIEASSAAQAHQRFQENWRNLGLGIADLGLPDGSGVEVALAFWSESPNLRIIITSGHPLSMWRDQDASTFEKLLPDAAVLLKPFFPAKLIKVVEAMIGPPQQAQSDETS